jgi:hypothetical protein
MGAEILLVTPDERLSLARVFVRASLALPNNHPVQEAIDAAVAALLDRQPTTKEKTIGFAN